MTTTNHAPICKDFAEAISNNCTTCMMHYVQTSTKNEPITENKDRESLKDSDGRTNIIKICMTKPPLDNYKLKTFTLKVPLEAGLRDNDGKSALMYAIENGHTAFFSALIPQEAYLQDNNGKSTIELAFEYNYPDLVRDIVDYRNIDSPLTWLLQYYEDYGITEEVLIKCVDILKDKYAGKVDHHHHTALIYAIDKNLIEIVKILMDKEFSVNTSQYMFDSNPLSYAIFRERPEIVKLFVDNGYIDKYSLNKVDLMQAAIYRNNVEIAKQLMCDEACDQDNKGRNAITYAVINNKPDIVKLLVENDYNKNYFMNKTALMCAAELGYTDIVELLIPHEKGQMHKNGKTAFNFADEKGHKKIAELLLSEKDIERPFTSIYSTKCINCDSTNELSNMCDICQTKICKDCSLKLKLNMSSSLVDRQRLSLIN